MKKYIYLLVLLTCSSASMLKAQTLVTIGTGTGTLDDYPIPYYNLYTTKHIQFVIRASELNAAGMSGSTIISSLAMNVSAVQTGSPICTGGTIQYSQNLGWKISMKNTTQTLFSGVTFDNVGLTQVVNPIPYLPTIGWNTHTFNNTFTWDGSSNLLVDFCNDNSLSGALTCWGGGATTQISTTSYTSSSYIFADGISAPGYCGVSSGTNSGTSSSRPNFQLMTQSAISLPPVPPLANFDFTLGRDTIFVNSSSTIFNTSTGSDTNYWNITGYNATSSTGPWSNVAASRITYSFGDVMDSSKHFVYTYPTRGYYLVKLSAKNKYGMNFIEKPVWVDTPSSAPRAIWFIDKVQAGKYGEFRFFDQSTNGPSSWKWTISPQCYNCSSPFQNLFSNDAAANPVLAAQEPGIFSICLKVTNNKGSDSLCRTNYIEVKQGYQICTGQLNGVSTDLEGYLSASGSNLPGAPYTYNAPNCSYGFTISPCTDTINVNIERLRLRSSDSVLVRSGSITGPIIRRWGGNNINAYPDSLKKIKFAGLQLFITFEGPTSSTAIIDSGFTLHWKSNIASYPKPTAGFIIPDTIYSGYKLFPNNTTTGKNVKYAWDLNGDGVYGLDNPGVAIDSVTFGPNVTFGTLVPVQRNIRLRAYNCQGSDTMRKTIWVLPITEAPIVDFTVDRFTGLFAADVFTFTDLSQKGPTQWLWRFTPNSVAYVNGTSETSQYPQVVLTSSQKYHVTLTASNLAGKDSVTKNNIIEALAYEQPNSKQDPSGISTDIGITRVHSGTIDTTTLAKTPVYTPLYNLQKNTVYRGATYNVDVFRSTNVDAQSMRIWIDYNRNTLFGDQSRELILAEDGSNNIKSTASYTIPNDAPIGDTRMRIGVAANPVSTFSPTLVGVGVYEDYGILVAQDLVRPTIVLKGGDIVKTEVNKPFVDPGVIAMDNIEGDITSRAVTLNTVNTAQVGYYMLRYYVNDYYGNVSDTITRLVQVEINQTGPVITLSGSDTVYVEVLGSYTEPGYTAVDNTGNNITPQVTKSTNLDTSKVGNYVIRYIVKDAFGFNAQKIRTVIVRDTQKPVITTLLRNMPSGTDTVVHQKGNTYNDFNYINIKDNYWDDAHITFTRSSSSFNVNVKGIYTLRYRAVDGSGNQSNEYVVYVSVKDLISPTITLIGQNPIEIEVFGTLADPGATVTDNLTASSSMTVISDWNTKVKKNVVNSTTGYEVTYSATDEDGNIGSAKRIVFVVDNTPPLLELLGDNPFVMTRGKFFASVDPGVKLSDNYSAPSAIRLSIDTSKLNVNVAGKSYFVYYTAIDESGNTSETIFRGVQVKEWATGVNDVVKGQNTLSVFPNPSTGMLNITFNGDHNMIKVYNIVGSLVKSESLQKGQTKLQLDLGDVKDGIYFIRLEGKDGSESVKVNIRK